MSKQSRARAAAEATTIVASSSVPIEFSAKRWGVLLAGVLIVLAALAAYHNSFSGPFVLDDQSAITDNPSIKHFRSALSPPALSTAGSRPLLNLTYALNYAFGRMNVWGYHALNLAIHILAALTLFGIVRRTLLEHPPSPHSAGSGLRRTGPTSSFAPFGLFGKRRATEDRSDLLLRPIRQVQGYGGQVQPPTSKAIYPELSECGRGEPPSLKLRRPCLTPQIVIPSAARNLTSSPATVLAFFVALLWTVHPLQTEAVTYISQRAESLMGLFYLLTLYCFIRGVESRGQTAEVRDQIPEIKSNPPISLSPSLSGLRPLASDRCLLPSALWLLLSVIACFLGTMTKEVIVTAPVMVLLYDRTFVAGSFRKAWRSHGPYYVGLVCALFPLVHITTTLGQRSVGFDLGVTWWTYALTSCRSIVEYCKLTVWPHPLVFDYGVDTLQHVAEALPYALILAAFLGAVALALRYRPVIGFAGAWFFLILAPASSIIPVAGQPMAEHRLYLSLAAAAALAVLGLHRLIGWRSLIVCAAVAAGLGWLSEQRNNDYRSELAIWNDTVSKSPDNARAHNNLATVLLKIKGRELDAVTELHTALQIKPDYAEAHYNLAQALAKIPGHQRDTLAEYETALRLNPFYAEAHNNLGNLLLNLPGRLSEAITQFKTALRLKPDYADARNNLATALLKMPGRSSAAIAQYEAALRIDPDAAEAHYNLANVLVKMPGRLNDAVAEYETAIRIDPDMAEAHTGLGNALLSLPGRLSEAIAQCEAALRIKPDLAEAHNNLGNALLLEPGRLSEAIGEYQKALQLQPDYPDAHYNLGNAFFQLNRFKEAIDEYRIAIKLKPDYAEAHNNLGNALAESGRLPEAVAEYEVALQINPGYENALRDLEQVRQAMAQQAR